MSSGRTALADGSQIVPGGGGYSVIHFITMFDDLYAAQGKTMLESLYQHSGISRDQVGILRLGFGVASGCKDVAPIEVEQFVGKEKFDDLVGRRSWKEYVWTLEPCWVYYSLCHSNENDIVVYCDADLFFFNDPLYEIRNMTQADIALTPHYFPVGDQEKKDRVGTFNFGFGAFRNTQRVREVVRDWVDYALADCGETTAGHQRHLDCFPAKMGDRFVEFDQTHNAGPWRLVGCPLGSITPMPGIEVGEVRIVLPLISWHFHEFRRGSGKKPVSIKGQPWNRTNYKLHSETIRNVYLPYEAALEKHL